MTVYRVTIERLLYVVADNEWHAEMEAMGAEMNDGECEVFVDEPTTANAEADRWADAYPYNGNTKTVREHLKEAGR